jgi:hypothetical protein
LIDIGRSQVVGPTHIYDPSCYGLEGYIDYDE